MTQKSLLAILNLVLVCACGHRQASAQRAGDFNGDGFDDLALGVINEDIDGQPNAGAVNVLYGSRHGLRSVHDQFWSENSPGVVGAAEMNDHFGGSLAAGDFDGDGFDDLAIAVIDQSVDGAPRAGAVHILYGSAQGLTAVGDQMWTQNSPGVKDFAEANEKFGTSLATGDFDDDGFDDLAIGVPYESFDGALNAGAAHVLYGSSHGLRAQGNTFTHQGIASVKDDAEADDNFGYSLTVGDFDGDGFDDLAIGAPGETIGSILYAGAVSVFYGSRSGLTTRGDQFWSQDSPGIKGDPGNADYFGNVLTAGDFNGDGFDDLAVGVENDDVNGINNAGAVEVLYGSSRGLRASGDQLWSQDSPGVKDFCEANESFGHSAAAGDFDHDGFDDLAIGASNESVDGITDAGAVHVLFGSSSGLKSARDQFWSQNSPGIQDSGEIGDAFGQFLTGGDFNGDGRDDLIIHVPYEDIDSFVNAGAIHVLYGSRKGLTAKRDQFWNQNSPGVQSDAANGENLGFTWDY